MCASLAVTWSLLTGRVTQFGCVSLSGGSTMSLSPADKVHIKADFGQILANYPANNQLPPALQKTIDDLNKPYLPKKPNTPCCLQMCHAFNKSGIKGLCHVAVPRAGSVGASGIVRPPRQPSATWS